MNIFRISSFRKKYFNVLIVNKIINICIIRLFKKNKCKYGSFWENVFYKIVYICYLLLWLNY